jgi:hypothetical protein
MLAGAPGLAGLTVLDGSSPVVWRFSDEQAKSAARGKPRTAADSRMDFMSPSGGEKPFRRLT